MGRFILGATLTSALLAPQIYAQNDVKINEIVTNPQQDYNQSGGITDTDEYIELFNSSFTNSYSLEGWRLELIDTTPESQILSNTIIPPRGFYVIQNQKGSQNNNGQIILYDSQSNIVDSISYGNWEGATITNGNAHGLSDESLSRYPDGNPNWIKTSASRGMPNMANLESRTRMRLSKIPEGMRLSADVVLGKIYVLQQTTNLFGGWIDTAITNALGNSLSFNFAADEPKKFYRLKEENLP